MFKFRVWDKSRKKYCYCGPLQFHSSCLSKRYSEEMPVVGQLITKYEDEHCRPIKSAQYDTSPSVFFNHNQNDFVIEQWSGGYDLNEKPIYQGDLVEVNGFMKYEVDFDFTQFRLCKRFFDDIPLRNFYKDNYEIGDIYNVQIVGNIHERTK